MRQLLLITKNILKRMFKKPSSILLHIIMPVAISAAIFFLFSVTSASKFSMALVDLSQSKSSEAVIETIERTGKYYVTNINEDEASSYITDGMASFVLIIREDYEEVILSGGDPEVEIMSLKDSEGTAWINITCNYTLQNQKDAAYASNYDSQAYYELLENINDGEVTLNSESVEDVAIEKSVASETLGMYLMMIMLTAFNIAFRVLEEKRLGTFSRIGVAPVHARIYTVANVLSNIIVVASQITLVLLIITKVMGLDLHASFIEAFVILFVFGLCCISIGMLIATISKNSNTSNAIMSLVLAPTCMISGCFWPIEYMPEFLRKIAYIAPQRWTLDAFLVAQKESNFLSLLPNLGVVLGFTALFFLIAVYLVKAQNEVKL